jgi:pantoate--beta-alanine ligase
MNIVHTVEALRAARRALPGSVAVVPTMGALHAGHRALMAQARGLADHVITTIFVNPTQFGPNEDFNAYPRDLDRDAAQCEAEGCALVFAPSPADMYPSGFMTSIHVAGLTDGLCGPWRPGHFDGVATVVAKLLLITEADVAIFGQKDYQQLAVIRRMVADLNLTTRIIGAPTIREADGLAMSSRNRYLTADSRAEAVKLSRAMTRAWAAYQGGERDAATLVRVARALIETIPASTIDYIEVVDPDSLADYTRQPAPIPDARGAVIALAVRVAGARLIDNLRLDASLPAPLDPGSTPINA